MRDGARPGSDVKKDSDSHSESQEAPELAKNFITLNSLTPFPRKRKYASVPGRSFIKSSDKGEAIVINGPIRNFWFCSEPLNTEHTRRPASIQLITHSHAKLIGNKNDPSKGKNDTQDTTAEGGEDKTKNTTPEGYTWFEIRICENERDAGNGVPRTNDKGELLEWLSHRHSFQSEDEEWCLGRVFMHDENILKHVENGNVIAVYVCASGEYSNHAKEGYLCFDYGGYKGSEIDIKLPAPADPPEVLVYGEKRKECLMTPISGSSARNAVFIDGGVDLMERLLQSDAKNWTVKKEYLQAKHAAPDPHTIFDLENVKVVKGGGVTNGQYETVKQYTLHNHTKLRRTEDDPNKTAVEPIVDTKAGATADVKTDVPEGTTAGAAGAKPPPTNSDPKIIVWNDFGVRRSEAISAKSDARLLIYQMRSPIFQNELWDKARIATKRPVKIQRKDTASRDLIESEGLQKVLIVIDAEDLRAHGFNISRRVSWEKTMEDFNAHFEEIIKDIYYSGSASDTAGDKKDICENMHVIVRLGYEGAIYVPPKSLLVTTEQPATDSSTKASATNCTPSSPANLTEPLGETSPADAAKQEAKPQHQFYCYLVPDKAEGDLLRAHKGNVPGIDMAFVAGLVASLVRESDYSLGNLDDTQVRAAVDSALTWSHRFASVRFYEGGGDSLNYPRPKHFDLDKYLRPRLISVQAQGTIKEKGDWSLFNLLSRVKTEVSSDIVTKGSTAWLESSVPTARFGNLLTADRIEIECFRSTAAVIDEYLASPPGKPLSIAVFGSPGAGKSFGVKEVISTMLPDAKEPIEVNLSQFMSHSELLSTFHNIRDMALAGKTPVVMFDEFDSVFEQAELGWLKYFLAPMQDGYFLENGQQRTLKNAIFIFIGGTSSTWADFTEGMDEQDEKEGKVPPVDTKELQKIEMEKEKAKVKRDKDKKAKKPDFVSRLSAYIDIRGLNKIGKGDQDEMFTIRRAMILRSALARRLKVSDGKDIPIDSRVLNALLKQGEFRHGARSIALILQMSALSGRKRFEASALPADEQLSMHINVEEFKNNIRKDIHGDKPHSKSPKKLAMPLDIGLRKVLLKMER